MALSNGQFELLKSQGVKVLDERHLYVDEEVTIESGVVLYPNIFLYGKTHIGKGSVIWPGVVITDSFIGEFCHLKPYSIIELSKIGNHSSVGPMAHLRPGSIIKNHVKVGNFVEIKRSCLEDGVKVSHLSYVGDASIGERTNLGCGFITCNYDGREKHQTVIGKECFVGSDTQIVAPVKIGDRAYIASGSTINQDLQEGDFAIARSRQVNRAQLAKRFLKRKNKTEN